MVYDWQTKATTSKNNKAKRPPRQCKLCKETKSLTIQNFARHKLKKGQVCPTRGFIEVCRVCINKAKDKKEVSVDNSLPWIHEKFYKNLSPEDQIAFWNELAKAIKWRGWDKASRHSGIGSCHACSFIQFCAALALKYGWEFEEYT